MDWFGADKKGLEKIARRRGLAYVLFELVQNCWDTDARVVRVSFTPVEGRPLVDVVVEDDDPDGFKNLAHAWTLFAESEKKSDPQKRGRFNLGEKLVLAICDSAEIVSTKGNVRFDDEGRHVGRKRTRKGSVFTGRVKMTRNELDEILAAARELIPPPGVVTTINDESLKDRPIAKTFEVSLPTEVADEEGHLRRTARQTIVNVYDALPRSSEDNAHDEPKGWIYEMGIPVCPAGGPWDLEVMQKVPVNLERNSVSASFLRTLRVHALNEMHTALKKSDAAKPEIQDALTDERILPAAVETVLTQQYGEKRAIFDPSDTEANNRLTAEGYTVIPGGAFSKDAWKNIRSSSAAFPSGQIRPTPKPYSQNGSPAQMIHEDEWTVGMARLANYASDLGWKLLKRSVRVHFERGRLTSGWTANYSPGELVFNYDRLGKDWFERGPRLSVNQLLIHEFAHESAPNHLSDAFSNALEELGAKLADLAFADPEFFRKYDYRSES